MIILSFGIFERNLSPTYKGQFTLLISDPLEKDKKKLGDASEIANFAMNSTDNDLPTLIEFLKSPTLLDPILDKYNISHNNFINDITLESGGTSGVNKAKGILKVVYYSKNKKEGEKIIKELSEIYLETALQLRRKKLQNGLMFLNDQYPSLHKKNSQIQDEILIFRKKNNLIKPEIESKSIKELLQEKEIEVSFLESENQLLKSTKEEIISGNVRSIGFVESIGNNSGSQLGKSGNGLTVKTDQSLFDQVMELEGELARARTIYKANTPILINLELRLSKLKPLLLENQLESVNSALNLNETKLKIEKRQRDELNYLFLKQPLLIKEYSKLQQELLVTEKNLDALISARETFQLEIAQNSVPWSIIQEPKFLKDPIKPSILLRGIYGVLFGVLGSIILTLLRDRFDYVYHDPSEVKELLKLPIIGEIPFLDEFKAASETNKSILTIFNESLKIDKLQNKEQQYKRFFYQESLRNLFVSIKFLNTDNAKQILLISSSTPSEGKSLINILLSKIISDFDKKVLLIDADMRKPKIHKRLRLNNIKGLSNLLTNESLKWTDCIQNISSFKNLSVITAGKSPPDPTRLINSKKLDEILKDIKSSDKFDYIIIDSPPLLGLSDTTLLSKYVDGFILLVALNQVKRNLPIEALNQLNTIGLNPDGIIINSTKKTRINISNNNGYYNGYYNVYANYVDNNDSIGQDRVEEKNILDNSEVNSNFKSKLKTKSSQLFISILNWFD